MLQRNDSEDQILFDFGQLKEVVAVPIHHPFILSIRLHLHSDSIFHLLEKQRGYVKSIETEKLPEKSPIVSKASRVDLIEMHIASSPPSSFFPFRSSKMRQPNPCVDEYGSEQERGWTEEHWRVIGGKTDCYVAMNQKKHQLSESAGNDELEVAEKLKRETDRRVEQENQKSGFGRENEFDYMTQFGEELES